MVMPLYECVGAKIRPSQKSRYLRNSVLNRCYFVLYFFFLKKKMNIEWSYFLKNMLQVLNNRKWNLTFTSTSWCLLIKILQFLLSKILYFVLISWIMKPVGLRYISFFMLSRWDFNLQKKSTLLHVKVLTNRCNL